MGGIAEQSDLAEREVIFPGSYQLRHIAPKATAENQPGIVNPLGAGVPVLAQTLYAKPLPVSHEPTSPDFHEGNYTLRLNDAGEFTLSFPNRDASDGQPWRSRFDNNGHKEFIEISHEGEVEFIGTIVKILKERSKITISGYDGLFLLKKAYEKEYRGVTAPRDMIERYCRVDTTPVVTDFTGGTLPAMWANTGFGGHGYSMLGTGISISCFIPKIKEIGEERAAGSAITTEGNMVPVGATGGTPTWQATTSVLFVNQFPKTVPYELALWASDKTGTKYVSLQLKSNASGTAIEKITLAGATSATAELTKELPTTAPYSLDIRSDGRWISGYVNGILIGYIPAFAANELYIEISLNAKASGLLFEEHHIFAGIGQTFLRIAKPFLLRGANKGEYVLPGSAATYPYGGLRADYYVHGGSGAGWQETVLAPNPRKPEPVVWQEPEINHTGTEWVPPVPVGEPPEYFAVRWYGAIYLDLEHNADVGFALTNLDDGARLWVGKTGFGDQIIDEWKTGGSRTVVGKVTAASLGAKKGWFPIVLEYFNGELGRGIILSLEPKTTSWTDPGGTFIAGKTVTVVPSTSLSPLGCFDEPIQGQSHYDIIENVSKQFGYQFALEPKQLESGEFPGQVVPRARQGQDYDEIVEVDDIDRKSGINNYTYSLDSTDSATSIAALGSGIADGKGSQVAFETVAVEPAEEALFDIQAFITEGNVAEPALLAALAEAQLALRLGAWDNLSGEPIAKDRLADTFPLTGKLSLLKWRAGDGVRVWLPDVGVEDTTPRAIMQVTRNFSPDGRTGTQIGFRSRPKDALYAIRQLLRSLALPHRASQGVYEDMPGIYCYANNVPAKTIAGNYSFVTLHPQDRVVSAKVRIPFNASKLPVKVLINGVDRTTELGGPWSSSPIEIPCTQFATAASTTEGRVFARVENAHATETNSEIDHQLVVTVLRA